MNDDFKFTGARYFLNIPAEIAHDPNLKKVSKLLFGEVYSMLNVTGAFYMSNKELAKRLCVKSTKTVTDAISELEKYGYLQRQNIYDKNTGSLVGRKITSNWRPGMPPIVKNYDRSPSKKLRTPIVKNYDKKEHLNKKEEEEINKKENLKSSLLQELKRFAKCEPNENEWQIVSTLSIRLTYDSLRMVTLNFMGAMHDSEIQKPYAYLIKMMRDELENQKLR